MNDRHRLAVHYLGAALIVCLFFPLFKASFDLLFEYILTAFLFIYCCAVVVSRGHQEQVSTWAVFISLLFLSLLAAALFRGIDSFAVNDVFELAKPLYFLVFFTVSYGIEWNERRVILFSRYLFGSLAVLSVFGIFEATSSIGNTIGHTLYKDLRNAVQFKAVGPFISPYVFGSILILPVFFYLSCLLKGIARYASVLLLVTTLTCILFTQSRTIFISISLTFLVACVMSSASRAVANRGILLGGALAVFSTVAIFWGWLVVTIETQFPYLYSGLRIVVTELMSPGGIEQFLSASPSIWNRYQQFLFVLNLQDSVPLIGVSVGKAIVMPESFYAMYLLRTGLLGIAAHFAILGAAFTVSVRMLAFHRDNPVTSALLQAIAVYLVSLPISYASSAVNDQTRTGFIFYILLGLLFSLWRTRERLRPGGGW